MIRAVVLDWGGVLTHTPPPESLARLAGLCGCEPDVFETTWKRHRLDYDVGALTAAEFWRLVALEPAATLDELLAADAEAWSNPNREMVEWLVALKAAGFRTAVLSNVPREQWLRLSPVYETALASCDHLTLSFELGVAKPDERIYRHCLERIGVAPEEILFVDDLAPNVAAARALGIGAVRYEGLDALRAELRSRALPPI